MTASTLSRVNDFLSKQGKHYIGGKRVDSLSGKTFDTPNPATGQKLATVADGQAEDIDAAVAAARKAFDPWQQVTPAQKAKIVWKIGDLIEAHADELAELESLDNGKPKTIAAAVDLQLARDTFHYMAGWATKIEGATKEISTPYTPGAKYHAYTRREPVGVVGQIIPWNFPLLMASWKLAPALATGNTVVLKPAEQTPLSVLYLVDLLEEAGVPAGVINIVTGFGEAGAALAAHDDVDKIAFTGSTEVGKLIVGAARGNLKKVTLELGGKAPNIIFNDANLEAAIATAANAIFINSGQICCAGSRLYVESGVYDEVIAGVTAIANGIKVGPGLAVDTQMGPLTSQEQFDRVSNYVKAGIDSGATVAAGGDAPDSGGFFFSPTVLTDTRPEMTVVAEEIFGPVLVANKFDDVDEVIATGNNTSYGLSAGVWTQDVSKAHQVAARLQAGTLWVNCYNIFDASLPFGGYKQSGWGRENGAEILDAYTQTKAVVMGLL
ncbi:MAG TPA: aldehyde dehydrogenase family protein [Sporichthyaceae bacterium]|nr:aldehyde dehydrogenase family protein [Sporichthyaceae bacterium]